MANEYLVLLNI